MVADPGTSTYADRPWLSLYREGQCHVVEPEFDNLVDMFAEAVRSRPHQDAIRYFDGVLSLSELNAAADAFAAALQAQGFTSGDRLAVFSQNHPAFVIAMLAAWKAGGAAVSVNPMYREAELGHVLQDSGAKVLLCFEELQQVAEATLDRHDTSVEMVVVAAARDFQQRGDTRILPEPMAVVLADALVFTDLIREYAGCTPRATPPARPDDLAFLVYTSGTTGPSKGALLTHANFIVNARNYREWMELGTDDVVLALAPLFHITGLVGHAILSFLLPAPLVLGYRFHPEVMVDLIREHRPTFTVGAITAFSALVTVPEAKPEDFSSLTKVYSGGAPVAPAVAAKVEACIGSYVHNAYGLTETSSITHIVPPHRRAPVDPTSGALSIGVPIASVAARIVDDKGAELPPGQVGELLISGPQVCAGYWQRPEISEAAFPGGALRTGDVAFMDDEGWFYLVDRKKDMIIASGYKVWPREVEDVLYEHPAVLEAAVVGFPDEYRGESVAAFVSLRDGQAATAQELIEFCRDRLAAYKYPRRVTFIDTLPKTASGKILRRELRVDQSAG